MLKNIFLKQLYLLLMLFLFSISAAAQEKNFTREDSLLGTLTPYRTCYDVHFYDLQLDINLKQKHISGRNIIYYKHTANFDTLQIDLWRNLQIDSIIHENKPVNFYREERAVFVVFNERQFAGELGSITVWYRGIPVEAKNPPWDGGITWSRDSLGTPWAAVSCEGIGASVWWPNKDHPSDEPDSVAFAFNAPAGLMGVSNGNLRKTELLPDGQTRYHWFVNYPINNYNVTFYIGNFGHFSDSYISGKDTLALDYYVLRYNLGRAKQHFEQVKPMLACFEKHFGPYPFPQDGYKLVEAPYWGMEHQSAIAYGNNYKNNKYGFDFIIVHESGHEWFGNSVTAADIGELWIHEGFCTYTEAVYVECTQGYETAVQYLLEQKKLIKQNYPILGPPDVRFGDFGSADMYYKGTWMLHTLRSYVNNDSLWFAALYDFATLHKISIVSTKEVVNFFSERLNLDLQPFFKTYLGQTEFPQLQYTIIGSGRKKQLSYRWANVADGFAMPVEVQTGKNRIQRLNATTEWQRITLNKSKAKRLRFLEERFLMDVEEIH